MSTIVAIYEPALAFRRGLAAALADAGFVTSDDPSEAQAAVVTLRDDDDCAVVEQLAGSRVVVALLPDPTPAAHAHALSHGAAGVADWAAAPDEIARAVADAIDDRIRLPRAIALVLAAEWPDAHAPRPDVSAEEAFWLAQLSAGVTVGRVADRAGYSERAMFRKLHDLYTRLGVTSRAEAIVAAERLGLLEPAPRDA